MDPVVRRVIEPGKAPQTRESLFPHFHQIYQNHHLPFSQHKGLGCIKLNRLFHFLTSRREPGIQRPCFLQHLHPESPLFTSASCSLTTESVRTVLGLSYPDLKRQHHCSSQSTGQTQGHGPCLTGNCHFSVYQEEAKGLVGY